MVIIHHKAYWYMNWYFLLKRYNFLQLQSFVYTPPQAATQRKRCLLMRQKSYETTV